MPSRNTKPRSAADGRLKANLPAERRAPAREKSRWQQLIDGDLMAYDLDDDEIKMGKCKDKNGRFSGTPPAKIPRQIHDAMRLEFQRRTDQKFQESVDVGYQTLLDVAQSKHAAAPARVAAAIHLIERGVGKVPDKVMAQVEVKPFEEGIEGLIVDVGEDNVYHITTAGKENVS